MLGILSWIPGWVQVSLALWTIVLLLAYHYFTSTFNYWRDKGVVFIKPYPFIGSIPSLMTFGEHLSEFNQRMYQQYEGQPYVGLYQGRNPVLLVLDPELVKHIFVKDFAHFVDHGMKVHEEADPLQAKNLFNMEGDRWRQMRVKLTPTFTSGRMKAMFPLVLDCSQKFEQHLDMLADKGDEFEAKDLLSRFTTDVIASCAFGIKCDSLKDPHCEFRELGKQLVEMNFWRAIKTAIIVFMPQIGLRLRLSFIDMSTTNALRKMVRDVIEFRARTGETRKDFMQLLIELKEKGRLADEDGEKHEHVNLELTDDDVTAQATVFFLAGFETSSTVMSFALLELALNKDVQNRAQEEIDEVLQRHDGQISYQCVQDMKYIDWVISESMRKYPPVASHLRICTKNYRVPGSNLTIEEGTMINVPVHAMQNDPKYFPNPDTFDPERFKKDETSQKNKYVFTPFGEGPRQCIGNRFALMQSKLGLLAILRKHTIITCPRTEYPAKLDPKQFILTTKNGVWLKVAPRH